MRRFSFVFMLAGVAIGFVTPRPAMAATFVVTSSADTIDAAPGDGVCANSIGGCTLRAAIQEANALVGTDTITLPGSLGTYFISITGRDEDAAATGDFDVTSTIIINGAGASTTIINGSSNDRVFHVLSPGALTLTGVTVRGGLANADLNLGFPVGGGILATDGTSLTVTNSVVRNNATSNEGGYGGGILVVNFETLTPPTVTITNSLITQNNAPPTTSCSDDCAGAAAGLGFFGPMTVTVTNSTISENTAEDAGGIATGTADSSTHATVTITGSTISGNSVTRRGGGTAGPMTIANSTISGNSAAEIAGAVLYDEFGFVRLINVTITNNSSGVGGAIAGDNCFGSCPTGEVRMQNTIVANNTGAASANCMTGAGNNVIDQGNNLEFPGTSCGFTTNAVHANPLLGPLVNNGGPTQTHALTAGSPAIDAGNNAACAASPVNGVDQRGLSRSEGASCDIGSYEFAATAPPPSQDTRVLDLDGDAIDDLVWRHLGNGDVAVWLMDGTTVKQGPVVASGVPLAWQIAGVGDLDGDSKADLVWRHSQTGDVAVWLMDGTTVRGVPIVASGVPLAWQIVGVADLDGDGNADLVWRHRQTGDVAVWLMDGSTVLAGPLVASGVPLAWQIHGVNDLDGDGKADLLWRQTQTGDVAAWLMDGTTVRAIPVVVSGVPLVWQIAGVDDLDGDNKADVVWRRSNGDVAVWLMDGATILQGTVIASGVPAQWQIQNVEDLNGDGNADIVWRHSQTGDVAVWFMDGATVLSLPVVASGVPLAWDIQ